MSYIVCKCVPWALRPPGPNRPPWFLPFHFHSSFTPSDMAFFCRCLPTRLVPGPPRRRPWIGTPSRPHLPSPIVLWLSGEAQDIASRKRPRIPLPIPLRTIRERVWIYGTTTHIPDPSTKVVTAAVRRFSEPWRLPKTRTQPRRKNSGIDSLNYNRIRTPVMRVGVEHITSAWSLFSSMFFKTLMVFPLCMYFISIHLIPFQFILRIWASLDVHFSFHSQIFPCMLHIFVQFHEFMSYNCIQNNTYGSFRL